MSASKLGIKFKQVSPLLLTIVSIAGTIGTAALASIATLKVEKIFEEEQKEKELTVKDKAQIAIRQYAPTIFAGGLTIASIAGAQHLNRKQIASLAGSYAAIAASYKKLESKTKELFGEDGLKKVKQAIIQEKISTKKQIDPDDLKCTFYEEFRGELFERTDAEIIEAEYAVNRLMAKQGYVSLNNFYEFLDLPPIDSGDELGWSYGVGGDYDGYQWIDFKHETYELEDGMVATSISYPYPPVKGFMN